MYLYVCAHMCMCENEYAHVLYRASVQYVWVYVCVSLISSWAFLHQLYHYTWCDVSVPVSHSITTTASGNGMTSTLVQQYGS